MQQNLEPFFECDSVAGSDETDDADAVTVAATPFLLSSCSTGARESAAEATDTDADDDAADDSGIGIGGGGGGSTSWLASGFLMP